MSKNVNIIRRYCCYKLNNDMKQIHQVKPYTYLVKFKPTGKVYYGSRCQNYTKFNRTPADDFWHIYTTSSNTVNALIVEYGKDSFEYEIRRTFESVEKMAAWESKVLTRCQVLERQDIWMNSNIAGKKILTEEGARVISETHKDKPKTEEHKKNLSESQKGSKRPWSAQNLPKNTKGENNGMYGKKHSEETKAKIGLLLSERIRGNNNPMKHVEWTEERRKSMGDRSRGTKWTQEAIDARSAKLTGQRRQKLHCPHCQRDIAVGWYNRHGPNCKHRQ